MIEISKVTYTYPKYTFTLQETTFQVVEGKCLAVVGANGTGKTTLGKLVGGVMRPQTGEIFIDGEASSCMSLGMIGEKVGYLFQNPARQLFAPTVLEELTFTQLLKGIGKEEAEEKARATLKRFKLQNFEKRAVARLSGGEKQRLAICALLCSGQKYLILDEPTTGLDKEAKIKLSHLIGELKNEGVGILLISHEELFVKQHATYKLVMEGGRIIDERS